MAEVTIVVINLSVYNGKAAGVSEIQPEMLKAPNRIGVV